MVGTAWAWMAHANAISGKTSRNLPTECIRRSVSVDMDAVGKTLDLRITEP